MTRFAMQKSQITDRQSFFQLLKVFFRSFILYCYVQRKEKSFFHHNPYFKCTTSRVFVSIEKIGSLYSQKAFKVVFRKCRSTERERENGMGRVWKNVRQAFFRYQFCYFSSLLREFIDKNLCLHSITGLSLRNCALDDDDDDGHDL